LSRYTIIVRSDADRQRAVKWASAAKPGMRIEFKEAKRSTEQNDRMWAMLTDVARQALHQGRRYTPDQWKVIFMHACGREVQFLPSLDGSTFIPWGQSSSDLSKPEMSDLMELIAAWGAQNGVAFNEMEPERASA
jgi:hypothetical protein